MAFGPNTTGLVPLTGPYGTYQIPGQVAGAFGLPGPLGPPPTFQPGELEGAILGDVPRVTEPPPPIVPELPPAPVAAPIPAPPDLAPSVTRGPLPVVTPQPYITPEEQAALVANRGPGPQPQPPAPAAPPPAPGTLASMYANLEQRKDIARRRAELESNVGSEEARILDAANAEDDRLAKLRDAERGQANKELAAARAKQASAMDAYVNHKVDQNRLWHNMGTGSKILAGIGIAMSGLGNALAKKGDARNPALDMIMGAIKDDVALQLAERDRLGQIASMRKDAINDLRTQYADGEAAYQGIIAGNTRRVANQVAAAAARAKDPAAKLRGEEFAVQLNGEADRIAQEAQARDAATRQQQFENKMKQSQVGLGWAQYKRGITEDDRNFAEKQRQFDVSTSLDYQKMMAAAEKARAEGNVKEAEQIEKKMKEERELAIGGFNRQPLKNQDGSVFKSPDTHEAAKLRKQVTAGAEAIRIIDQIKQLREKHGSEWFKTEAARQLKANMAALQLEIKNTAELGVLAGPDMGLIDNYIGTGDAAELDAFGSLEKGLDEVRNNLRSKVQRSLETANFTGQWTPPDLSQIKNVKSDADVAAQAVREQKTTSEVEKASRPAPIARGIARAAVPLGDLPADVAAREEATARSDWELPGVTKEAATGYRALAALATGKDEMQAQRARENLSQLATTGNTEQRLAAIKTMRNAGLDAEADAATAELPKGVQQFVGAREAIAPQNDNVASLESAARSGDAYARISLAQIARAPGPEQKAAGEALIRLQRGGSR